MKCYPSLGSSLNSSQVVETDAAIVETIGKYVTCFGALLHFVRIDKKLTWHFDGKDIETDTVLLANE